MPKFRKKPVVIEAHQWQGPNVPSARDVLDFVGSSASYDEGDGSLFIKTLEGTMEASLGDWVIRGVAGEFYPCKDSIFQATYEPAPDDA